VIASAATDEDAPPEPAKAYFAAFTARLNRLLKNSSFVSGHRFSDAASSLN
jgi:hypothetical protein